MLMRVEGVSAQFAEGACSNASMVMEAPCFLANLGNPVPVGELCVAVLIFELPVLAGELRVLMGGLAASKRNVLVVIGHEIAP
jgi:hypothetical protein